MTTAIGTSNPSTSSIRLSFPPILAILPTGSPLLAFRPLRAAHRGCRLRSSRPDVCLRRRPADGWRRFQVQCGVAVIDHSRFEEEVLKSDGPVLVEFVADWCGPCRLISPVVEWASQEYKDSLKVVKIDHDANPLLIEEYKVYGLPALILFKDGQEVPESRREGAMTKLKLKEYLDSFLGSVTVS